MSKTELRVVRAAMARYETWRSNHSRDWRKCLTQRGLPEAIELVDACAANARAEAKRRKLK